MFMHARSRTLIQSDGLGGEWGSAERAGANWSPSFSIVRHPTSTAKGPQSGSNRCRGPSDLLRALRCAERRLRPKATAQRRSRHWCHGPWPQLSVARLSSCSRFRAGKQASRAATWTQYASQSVAPFAPAWAVVESHARCPPTPVQAAQQSAGIVRVYRGRQSLSRPMRILESFSCYGMMTDLIADQSDTSTPSSVHRMNAYTVPGSHVITNGSAQSVASICAFGGSNGAPGAFEAASLKPSAPTTQTPPTMMPIDSVNPSVFNCQAVSVGGLSGYSDNLPPPPRCLRCAHEPICA